MSHGPLVLAIDLGGQSARAIVVGRDGVMVAEAGAPIETRRPRDGWVQHDAQQVVRCVREAVDGAATVLGRRIDEVAAAGLATQRSSVVCWDRRDGTPLSPVISWQGRRGADQVRALAANAEAIRAATGLVLSPHYGASKLRWCLDELAAVRAALDEGCLACGPIASFVLFRLLDERPLVVDPANASRTQLWDLGTGDWSPSLLELFGVPRAPLPACVPNEYPYGHLPLGSRGVPLTVCTGDQSAALFARGAPRPGTVWINAGTGAFVQKPVGDRPGDAPRLLSSLVWQDSRSATYVLEGTVNGAAAALELVREQLGLDPADRACVTARWLQRQDEPPLYLNGVAGLGSPWWAPDFRSRFVGDGEPWQKIVGVVESIAFLLAVNLEELGSVDRVVMSGGLSSLDGLCGRLADVAGVAVERPKVHEATARGLAWLVAGRPAHWIEPGPTTTFAPASNPPLLSRYRRWRAAMSAALGDPRRDEPGRL